MEYVEVYCPVEEGDHVGVVVEHECASELDLLDVSVVCECVKVSPSVCLRVVDACDACVVVVVVLDDAEL